MTIDIRVDDLRGEAVIALLREHLDAMRRVSPPESVHALDIAGLRQSDITRPARRLQRTSRIRTACS